MIMIMKKYNSPMLQVVSIKRSDIIATSGPFESNGDYKKGVNLAAPDHFRDFEWYGE